MITRGNGVSEGSTNGELDTYCFITVGGADGRGKSSLQLLYFICFLPFVLFCFVLFFVKRFLVPATKQRTLKGYAPGVVHAE